MSPEQTTGRAATLTTAADVYGLGAVLYALLAGVAPHTGSSFVETLDRVREAQAEPPSRRNPRVPRDMDVICLKCLEKDPKRRYASARELSDDLDRWLAGRPIAARPVGPAARALMWCRRNPLVAGLAALVLVSILGGLAGTSWKWREAVIRDREKARIVAFLSDEVLGQASTEANPLGDRFTVVEMLDRSAARIGFFQDEPTTEAHVREIIGKAYHSLARYDWAEDHLRAAVALDSRLYGPAHRNTLRVSNRLAAAIAGSGRNTDAERLLRRNLDACRRALGPDDPETLNASERLGVLLCALGRSAEAEPLLRRTLDDRRRSLPPDDPATLRSVYQLCTLLVDTNRLDEAEPLAAEYERGIRCALLGPKNPENVKAQTNLGLIRRLRGKPSEAEPYYRRAAEEARHILGPDHPTTLAAVAEYDRLFPVRSGPSTVTIP